MTSSVKPASDTPQAAAAREMQQNVVVLGVGNNPVTGRFGLKIWRRPQNQCFWLYGGKAQRLWELYRKYGDAKYDAARDANR